uniref:Uncharacterized protein n=1 Tax=Hyaloperonospora arabidopsidis (strain Emoy2) TaxID=559515 RepID=M4BE79_HYAAE
MTSRIKMLLSNAPPDALDNLLSPRRKFVYGLFAFGPGTVLGLYLYSVKKRMERENEAMRLEEVESELGVVQERQNKDLVLANAIQEMRDRLQRLEEEALASRHTTGAGVADAAKSDAKKGKTDQLSEVSAARESTIDAALSVLKSGKTEPNDIGQATAVSPKSPMAGSQDRRDKRHREILQQDIAAYIAKRKE